MEFSFRITQLNRCKNKSLSYGKQWIILLQNKPQHPPNHRARFGSSRPLCPAGSGICWLLIFHTMKTDSVRTTGKNTEASCSRHTPSCSEFTSDIHTVWDQIITRVKKHLIFYDKKFKTPKYSGFWHIWQRDEVNLSIWEAGSWWWVAFFHHFYLESLLDSFSFLSQHMQIKLKGKMENCYLYLPFEMSNRCTEIVTLHHCPLLSTFIQIL